MFVWVSVQLQHYSFSLTNKSLVCISIIIKHYKSYDNFGSNSGCGQSETRAMILCWILTSLMVHEQVNTNQTQTNKILITSPPVICLVSISALRRTALMINKMIIQGISNVPKSNDFHYYIGDIMINIRTFQHKIINCYRFGEFSK